MAPLKVAFFDTHRFERPFFERAIRGSGVEISFFEPRLQRETAKLAEGFDAVCIFVNDRLDADCVEALADGGVRFAALRSAGFNHVDLRACEAHGIAVARVPAYSPHAVAEHTLCLLLTLNRKVHRAYARVRDLNFSIEGLVGFDLFGKTVGVIGTGKIGEVFARIVRGIGCRVLAFDSAPSQHLVEEGIVEYCPLGTLLSESDVVSLHVPLTDGTRHLIDGAALAKMKSDAILLNTGRGALVDTRALVDALKTGRIGGAGLDVYEEEEGVFFFDRSEEGVSDDVLARLLTFPNVLVTSHQAFLTKEALRSIAQTTVTNFQEFAEGAPLTNGLRAP